ncbi:ABC transporter ATP-binding protein [Streptomyces bingchenggensis BCW-1]|uniref:ABC transporter ATP-binding protein n=1 Tax=Streptomyces bingchenggensis (strain BCW-1) TaxID=749414 RepID=D7CA65_STRBB|nr:MULTISPECIES: ABC transporter ATP-binding protein [Streptomyces]ADI06422.1 ABC transporter ATP-binding protein [Streptomyces bingchenggensis BCW-1]
MIQATGLTSTPRRNHRPAVDDLTFEAPPGRVTALFGAPGAGKTSALRLLLQLDRGHGAAFFRGRPLHRIRRPAREIGVLLDDVPGHPGRTARGHLRMLGAAVGVPAARADVVLDVVGLTELADERIGDLAAGMERRLGLATALLGDPHTLVLDAPTRGLSARETVWMHGLLRQFAGQGGAVLVTEQDPESVTRLADQVLTLDGGRLIADQPVDEFARTRLRPRVAVLSPLAGRLAAVLEEEARAAQPPAPREAEDEGEVKGSADGAEDGTKAEAGAEAVRVEVKTAAVAGAMNGAVEIGALAVNGTAEATAGAADGVASGVAGGAEGEEVAAAGVKAEPDCRTGQPSVAVPTPAAPPGDALGSAHAAVAGGDSGASDAVVPGDASGPADVARPVDASAPTDVAVSVDVGVSEDAVPAGVALSEDAVPEDGVPADGVPADAVPAVGRRLSVVREDETRISVYGLPCAAVGEAAYRHGIVVHRLVEETADMGLEATRGDSVARGPRVTPPRVLPRLPLPGPAWPLRYELRRATGVRTGWLIAVAALVASLVGSVLLARAGGAGELHRITGWPADVPLPPVAIASGLLGALSFGEEFRYPALAPARDTVPRRLSLLTAKFLVCAVGALLLSFAILALDGAALLLLVGGNAVPLPGDWPMLIASVCALAIGSGWAGLMAAAVFRSTALGLATLLAVPVMAVPVVERLMAEPSVRSLVGLPHRLRAEALDQPHTMVDRALALALRLASQPVGQALLLSLVVLLCAYALTGLRGRARQ